MNSTRSPRKELPWIVQVVIYTVFLLGVGLTIALVLGIVKWVGHGL